MKALLLVDLQNDFGGFGALPIKGSNELIPIVNQLINHGYFDLVVACKSWHPADHTSFAANHFFRYPKQIVEINGVARRLWIIHCVQDSLGAELIDGLHLDKINQIISKGMDKDMDSYSCFYGKNKEATELTQYLRGHKVQEVFLSGLRTEYGIKETALDAKQLGFKTFVLEDACCALNIDYPDDGHQAILALQKAGIILLDSDQLILYK